MKKFSTSTIGITLGDPAGIGPEVIARALKHPAICKIPSLKVIGDRAVFRHYGFTIPEERLLDLAVLEPDDIRTGKPSSRSARAALIYLEKAVELLKEGRIGALVTAPVCKQSICRLGLPFSGHTEFLAEAFKVPNVDMMFVSKGLKTVIATRHVPLKDVSRELTVGSLLKTIQQTDNALKTLFKIKKPRIAVCGLNPHAGEGGEIGTEEIRVILPALKKARQKAIHVCGPFAADTLFHPHNSAAFDAIIAMYHDQGLTPIKSLYFYNVVNLTIGLPFIRTSPSHGTGFDIAGQHQANPNSMIEAILLAYRLRRKAKG